MSIVDDFLKKMKMVSDDDYDDEDDYDDYDPDEEILSEKQMKKSRGKVKEYDDYADENEDEEVPAPEAKPAKTAVRSSVSDNRGTKVVGMNRSGASEVCVIVPKGFDDVYTVADILLSHKAVILNLEGIGKNAAQRIIDFTSGSCYTVGGNLQPISSKIFIVVPQDMNLSGDFSGIVDSMVNLDSEDFVQ